MTATFFVWVLIGPNAQYLTSVGDMSVILYTTVGAAVVNVALNLALIPQYGIEGAAIATLVSYIALNAARSWWLYRRIGLQPISDALLRPLAVASGVIVLLH